jgi:hypothetical protein
MFVTLAKAGSIDRLIGAIFGHIVFIYIVAGTDALCNLESCGYDIGHYQTLSHNLMYLVM